MTHHTHLIKPVRKIAHKDNIYEQGQEYEVSQEVVDALGKDVEVIEKPEHKPETPKKDEQEKSDESKKEDAKTKDFNPPQKAVMTSKETHTKKK